MAGVHRRQHVQRLDAAHFADHDTVRTHPQAVAHQLPLAHLAAPLDVRRPGFQAHHVGLLQLQFGRILDGDDPLVVRNETGQHIEHGGLAAAGTAGNQHVQAPTDNRLEQQGNGRGQRPHLDQAVGIEQVHRKAPDRHARAVDGQRRDNRVDPRTVLEPGIHQGRGLVDTPTQAGDDAVNDVQQMLIIAKTHIGALQFAEALDIDRGMTVDQNVGHAVISQQRFQRAKAEHLVGDLLDDQLAAGSTHRCRMLVEQALANIANLPRGLSLFQGVQQGQVHDLEQLLVDLFPPLGFYRGDLTSGFVKNVRRCTLPRHYFLGRIRQVVTRLVSRR
ncbi:hypothetical protein D3C73_728040 [compost metagenome]